MISFTSFVQIIFILLDQISLRLNILKRENKMKQKKRTLKLSNHSTEIPYHHTNVDTLRIMYCKCLKLSFVN